MAVQSKPMSSPSKGFDAGSLASWVTSHPAARPAIVALLFVLILARKRLASLAPQSIQRNLPASVRRHHALTDKEMDHALEEVYIPSKDGSGSYELLVPHRGYISKVRVNPTKKSTFDTHFADFAKLPPVAVSGTNEKKKQQQSKGSNDGQHRRGINEKVGDQDEAEQSEEERLKTVKKQEMEAVRAEGGAAAASAKRVGVNKEFFRQLSALFKVMVPRSNAKEVFIFALHTSFLILRTYLR